MQILPLQSCELKKMPPSPSAWEAFFSIHTPGAGGFEPEFSHLPLWIVEFPIEFLWILPIFYFLFPRQNCLYLFLRCLEVPLLPRGSQGRSGMLKDDPDLCRNIKNCSKRVKKETRHYIYLVNLKATVLSLNLLTLMGQN